MKNLGYYVGSVALGLSLTMGACEKLERIGEVVSPEPKTDVRLENILYYQVDGNSVCLYNSKGKRFASIKKGNKDLMVVRHTAWIRDGDFLKEIYHGRFHKGRHMHEEYGDVDGSRAWTDLTMTESAPVKHFDKPYMVIVSDMKGNQTTFDFSLEYVKKHGKIADNKAPNEKGKCDRRFN